MKCRILCVLAVIIMLCGCTKNQLIRSSQDSFGDIAFAHTTTSTAEGVEIVAYPLRDDFRCAVWMSYLDLYDFLNSTDESELRNKFELSAENLLSIGATDVFFQVRAFGDALYRSKLSASANGITYGNSIINECDILQTAIEVYSLYGITLHAWMNPYRLPQTEDKINVFKSSVEEAVSEEIVEYDGKYYLEPSSDAVIDYITECAREIIENYDIGGIHFDDYFYPTTDEAFDGEQYADYLEAGGSMSLGDWRRYNVSALLRSVSEVIDQSGKAMEFSIAPDSSISRNYGIHYLDIEMICADGGIIDFVCPQIYYGYDNDTMAFSDVLSQWSGMCGSTPLMTGLAFYKTGQNDQYAGSGAAEWQNSLDIIQRQFSDSKSVSNCIGVALFRYDSVFEPAEDVSRAASIQLDNLKKELNR